MLPSQHTVVRLVAILLQLLSLACPADNDIFKVYYSGKGTIL